MDNSLSESSSEEDLETSQELLEENEDGQFSEYSFDPEDLEEGLSNDAAIADIGMLIPDGSTRGLMIWFKP